MRDNIFWDLKSNLLFAGMCERCAFEKNERLSEFKIQKDRIRRIFESVSRHAPSYTLARWTLLRKLWISCKNSENVLQAAYFASNSSYRRKSEEQQTRKPNNDMRTMPSASPSWHASNINKVTFDSGTTHDVYDIQVKKCHNFFAEGILASNCIIIDDPNSVDDIDSETTIQTAIDWWEGTMPTRLNNQETGAYIIIQQRTFENDLTGHILEHEAEDWVHLMIPMRYEPDRSFFTSIGWKDPRTEPGELMWPERFSESTTKRLEKRLGPYRTAGQLQQRPEPAGGGIIKREWWQPYDATVFPPMDFILGLLDTAYTEETMNDPSGMLILGVFSEMTASVNRMFDKEGKEIYLGRTVNEHPPKIMTMYAWDEHLEFHALINRVAKTCKDYKVDLLLIENKSSGISVAQEMRRLYANEKFGVQLFDPKSQDKIARLYSIQHLFAEEIIYAPNRIWSERVITQVGQFPKGKHDEYVDLVSMGLRHLRDNGLISRAPERLAEIEESKQYRSRQEPLYPS